MKILLLVLSAFCFCSVAVADNSQTQTTEQRKTKLDAQTGEIQQENAKQEEHQEQRARASGAYIEQRKTDESSTADNYGKKTETKDQEKRSAELNAEPDGDVSVDQKTERTQQQTIR